AGVDERRGQAGRRDLDLGRVDQRLTAARAAVGGGGQQIDSPRRQPRAGRGDLERLGGRAAGPDRARGGGPGRGDRPARGRAKRQGRAGQRAAGGVAQRGLDRERALGQRRGGDRGQGGLRGGRRPVDRG